jgi:hypothetical protein
LDEFDFIQIMDEKKLKLKINVGKFRLVLNLHPRFGNLKKRKNKERGPNWTPLDLPYSEPPLNLVNLLTSRTWQV